MPYLTIMANGHNYVILGRTWDSLPEAVVGNAVQFVGFVL
jgi:hypothetical protein